MQRPKRKPNRNTVFSNRKISLDAVDWHFGKMPLDNTPVYLMLEDGTGRYASPAVYFRANEQWYLQEGKKPVNLTPRVIAYKRVR